MALTASNLWVPEPQYWNGSPSPGFTAVVLDNTADRCAFVFTAPRTGNVRKIRLRLGTVTKDVTTTLRASFQDVSVTTGDPDETDDAYRVIPNGDLVATTSVLTGIMSSDGTDGGTLKAVTRGVQYAVVVKYETFVAGDSIQIMGHGIGVRQTLNYYDYRVDNLTGAYAKSTAIVTSCTIQYDDGVSYYIPGTWPVQVSASNVFNSGSTPNVVGTLFSRPYSGKLSAAWLGIDADGDFDLMWYDAVGSTRLASRDKDVRSGTTGHGGAVVGFETEPQFDANTTYVIAVKPTTTTNLTLSSVDVAAVGDLDQLAVGQGAFTHVTATSPTTKADFTETVTRRPMIGVLVSAVDNGAGGAAGGLQWFGG